VIVPLLIEWGARAARAMRAHGALVVATLLLSSCAPGVPPPGPIDIVREIFDPNYDYTQSPDTWRDADARPGPPQRDGAWSSPCRERDLSCTHAGATVCCSPRDRCCAGETGPFCCSGEYTGSGDGWYGD